jgi:PGF-pre-PGF domain-containing protein
VNVGGDSAISRVTVTGRDISEIIVTAWKITSQPTGVASPDRPVYQYIAVVPARYTSISAALIEFDVPLFSIADPTTSMKNVSLCSLNNGTWMCLPTYRSGIINGKVRYRAESRDFSLFAITLQNETLLASRESIPARSPGAETSAPYIFRESNNSAMPEIPEKTEPPESDRGYVFLSLVSILGMIGIVIGGILTRSRWNR